MSEKKRNLIMSVEEWEQTVKELATPIDFDALIQAGVLKKNGAWYKILKANELPSHAKAKMNHMKTASDGSVLVKFSSSEKAAKLLKSHKARNK